LWPSRKSKQTGFDRLPVRCTQRRWAACRCGTIGGASSPTSSDDVMIPCELEPWLLVTAGFESPATLGFHVCDLCPPEMGIRALEHLLLELKCRQGVLDTGPPKWAPPLKVLTAYV